MVGVTSLSCTMKAMDLVEPLPRNLGGVVGRNAWWMGWNTLLAWVPVVLAWGLFRGGADRSVSRSPLWWAGLVLFVLFLPNAPYVVTDLFHLPYDLWPADHEGPAV